MLSTDQWAKQSWTPWLYNSRNQTLSLKSEVASEKPFSKGDKTLDLERTAELCRQMGELQDRLYAQKRHRVLIVLQGMDTSGKDGTIRSVFSSVDPIGVHAVAFAAPSTREKSRDYLWRIHAQVPGDGEITLFNRSHYEDVLVPVVEGWIQSDETERRFRQIRHFEQMLSETGTTVLKFFLHISSAEQRERLQARVDDPNKHWKFDTRDIEVRKKWDAYRSAYENLISNTGAPWAPWVLIPANSKTHRNLMVAETLIQALGRLDIPRPKPNPGLVGLRIE